MCVNIFISVITCDPPAPIDHTFYVPNNLIEHDWNTDIDYSCDPGYHYVSGIKKTTCNESGVFPPVDLDCSGWYLNFSGFSSAEKRYS